MANKKIETLGIEGDDISFIPPAPTATERGGVTTTEWNGKQDVSNKVISLSAQSTDTQYPSAKCVYDKFVQQSENIADLADMIAPQYDATATYALNALCIHENKLYKCTTAIETAEEWTAEHWTQTTLAALINA